jgi:hypothetical protein
MLCRKNKADLFQKKLFLIKNGKTLSDKYGATTLEVATLEVTTLAVFHKRHWR